MKFLKRQHKRNITLFPASIFPRHPSLRQLYASSVFLSFDNVMPTHQFRHGRTEVGTWYQDRGFDSLDSTYPGFFCARRTVSADLTA